MRSTQTLLAALLGAGLSLAANTTTYVIEDTYDDTNFFNEFDFFTATDPTQGFVDYVSAITANTTALAGYSNGGTYMGVDYKTVNPTSGRASVRVSSNKLYNHGLFIADIAHMPGSICGTWPAFWTVGANWPSQGEIDIIEGVNANTTDSITLHTSEGCSMASTHSLSGSILAGEDCSAGNSGLGCGFSTASTQGYGDGFNAVGGGVYAMEWTSSLIRVFFFPRTSIPADITTGLPDPSTWGTPTATFAGSGCDIDSHFKDHQIVFDTTFCGVWAGAVWGGSCAAKAPTCQEFVAQNPAAFEDTFWLVNSVKVYQEPGNLGKSKRAGVTAKSFEA